MIYALCATGWAFALCLAVWLKIEYAEKKEFQKRLAHGNDYPYVMAQEKNLSKPISKLVEEDIQRIHASKPVDPVLQEKILKQREEMRKAGRFDLASRP